MTGFLKDFDQILSVSPVTPFNKGNRRPGFPGSSSASATMNVIFNVTWEIIVDDMGDILTTKKNRTRIYGSIDKVQQYSLNSSVFIEQEKCAVFSGKFEMH